MKATRILSLIALFAWFTMAHAQNRALPASLRLRTLADSMYYNEEYPEALNLYIKAMELASKEGNDSNYIACTGYIGNVYDAFGDNKTCMFYYKKGYESAKRIGNKRLQTSFLTNIVTCYTRMGNTKEAKKYYNILKNIPENEKTTYNQYFTRYCKARILTAEHKYKEAVAEFHTTLDYANDNNMKPIFMLYQLSEIGNIYVRCGKPKEAISMGHTCRQMAMDIGSREMLVNAFKMLADAYSQTQHHDSALYFREKYFDLNDSVYNIKKFYMARYNLSEYENRMHYKQVSQLNKRILMQVYAISVVALFFIVVSLFSYIIYKKNKHLNNTQRLLIEKNNDLESREEQNRTLLRQYIEQQNKNGCINTSDNAYGKQTSCTPTDDKTGNERDEEREKQLLYLINNAMADMAVIANPDFSLQMLADMVESNTTYVSRVINNSYNKSFKTLLNELRIREACHKMTNWNKYAGFTMQAIYEEVGYRSASSFIRAFKKIYNMTPSEYIRLTGNKDK